MIVVFQIQHEAKLMKCFINWVSFNEKDHLNCGACGYDSCNEHAIAIIKGLAEEEMCLPYSIEKLHKYIKDLAVSNEKLASAQLALKQSEKISSHGTTFCGDCT